MAHLHNTPQFGDAADSKWNEELLFSKIQMRARTWCYDNKTRLTTHIIKIQFVTCLQLQQQQQQQQHQNNQLTS